MEIRRIRVSDLPFAMELSQQAGWNQLEVDWRRMLSMEPEGCFLALWNGRPAGTTVCCVFGKIAWLALVLVEQSLRGQGIGFNLVQTGIRYALEAGCKSIRLDATPLGRPVYERLDFRAQFELLRWSGVVQSSQKGSGSFVIRRQPANMLFDDLLELDRQATGTDRSKLLQHLFAQSDPWIAWDNTNKPVAYLASRPGRLAVQLGPACGRQETIRDLVLEACDHFQGQPLYIDIPSSRHDLNEIVSSAGLKAVRNLLRMGYGEMIYEDPESFHVSSGPELG